MPTVEFSAGRPVYAFGPAWSNETKLIAEQCGLNLAAFFVLHFQIMAGNIQVHTSTNERKPELL